MGLTSVAQAVAAWFDPSEVVYLSKIFPHPPKLLPEQDWYSAALPPMGITSGSGAVIYIHIDNRRQKRIGIGGQFSGQKWASNQVRLLCYLRSSKELAEDAGADNYLFLDAIESRLLAGRQLGTTNAMDIPAGAIFQAGEGSDTGGDDIDIDPGIPVTINGQVVQVFSTVSFTAVEILNS